MMTMFMRELAVVGRRRSFAVAAGAFVIAVAGFAIAWPTGVPFAPGVGLFSQLQVVQELLAVLIPAWIACRCGARDRGNNLVCLSAFSAVRPSRIVMARFAAVSASVSLVVLAALPLIVYAQQASAVAGSRIAGAELRVLAVAVTGVAVGLACEHLLPSYVWRWLAASLASMLTFVTVRVLGGGDLALAAIAVTSVAWIGLLAVRADTALKYLVEEGA